MELFTLCSSVLAISPLESDFSTTRNTMRKNADFLGVEGSGVDGGWHQRVVHHYLSEHKALHKPPVVMELPKDFMFLPVTKLWLHEYSVKHHYTNQNSPLKCSRGCVKKSNSLFIFFII